MKGLFLKQVLCIVYGHLFSDSVVVCILDGCYDWFSYYIGTAGDNCLCTLDRTGVVNRVFVGSWLRYMYSSATLF